MKVQIIVEIDSEEYTFEEIVSAVKETLSLFGEFTISLPNEQDQKGI